MIVGITGSIASGKSLVTKYLINKGYQIIDCDKISHSVLELDEAKNQVVLAFGNNIINNGKIDRKALGSLIFNDKDKKELLQSIVFPFIINEIKKQLSLLNGLIFLDAPLLIEYNLQYLVDKIIVIKTEKEIQLQRLMDRDKINKDYAIAKINSQLPIEEKEKYANYIVDNSLDIEKTHKQIDIILKQLEV